VQLPPQQLEKMKNLVLVATAHHLHHCMKMLLWVAVVAAVASGVGWSWSAGLIAVPFPATGGDHCRLASLLREGDFVLEELKCSRRFKGAIGSLKR
jgi:hypothetical protein